jgi:hypothetical protein
VSTSVFCAVQESTQNFCTLKKLQNWFNAACEHSKTATYLMGQMAIWAQQKLGKQNSHFDFVLLMDWLNTVGCENLRFKNWVKKYEPCCSGIDCFEVGFFPCSGMVWNIATVQGLQKRLTLGIWANVPYFFMWKWGMLTHNRQTVKHTQPERVSQAGGNHVPEYPWQPASSSTCQQPQQNLICFPWSVNILFLWPLYDFLILRQASRASMVLVREQLPMIPRAMACGSWKMEGHCQSLKMWVQLLRIDFIFNVDLLPNTDALPMNTIRWLYGVGFFVTTIKNYTLFFDVFGG